MSRWCLLLACVLAAARAEERWVELHSDGFRVLTDAGARSGRETLVRFEQFRYTLGRILGRPDLGLTPPPQILLFKTAAEAQPYEAAGPVQPGRVRFTIFVSPETANSPGLNRAVAKLLLDANSDRMPEPIERGLLALFSTLEVSGIRPTLGKPVPPAERDLDWARMHLLCVSPEYYGRMPVLLFNLARGGDPDAAYHNAFGKGAAEIEAETRRYLAAANFVTVSPPSKPMSAEHDFPEQAIAADDVRQILAGVIKDRELRAEYEKLLATARADADDGKAVAALNRAIELEPRGAEAYFLLARREKDPNHRLERLKTATGLDRRNAVYWKALAETYLELHNYSEASRTWRLAEQASTSDEQRAAMRQARLDVERQRLDFEEAERKRIADERARELEKLKQQEIARLRAYEAKVNQGSSALPAGKVVPWWDGPAPSGKAGGLLTQVDCLGRQARLIIQGDDHKILKLLVTDPSKIVVAGSNEAALGCGRQKPRHVSVEYFPKVNPKLSTAGEVATLEFR